MKLSEKQLIANRLNAQKSTGPRTAEGKARASINGYRHGLTGMGALMTDEDRQAKQALVGPYMKELDPVGMTEFHLAESIATDTWRLIRIRAVEDNLFAWGYFTVGQQFEAEHYEAHNALTQACIFADEHKSFNTLSLYEQRITRNLHKNLKLFYDLQARRKAEEQLKAKSEAQREAGVKPLTRTASASSPENGFAFSTTPEPRAMTHKPTAEPTKTSPQTTEIAA